MTPESKQVAAMMDVFPEEIRQRLQESMQKIADVYAEQGYGPKKPRQLPLWIAEGSNVIRPAAFQRKPPKRAPRRRKDAGDEAVPG